MRRTRRKLLRLLAVLVLLLAVLAGLVAAGWLPPFNRWVERRLQSELIALGAAADAAHLRELSWRRAVVGPVGMQLPGLVLRAEEVRAELGWSVLIRGKAPPVVVTGLTLDLDLARLEELRGAFQPKGGGFPSGRLELEHGKVVLRRGDERIDLELDGSCSTEGETFRAVLSGRAPALAGRVSVRGDLAADVVEFDFQDLRMQPERWRGVLAGWLPAAVGAANCAADGVATLNGSATLAEARWREVSLESALPALEWRHGTWAVRADPSTARFSFTGEGEWRGELRTSAVSAAADTRQAALAGLFVEIAPDTVQVRFAEIRAESGGVRAAGGGEATLQLGEGGTITGGEAKVRFTEADGAGWRLAEPAELRGRWDGAQVLGSIDSLVLEGALPVRLEAVELLAGGWREAAPQVRLTGHGACDGGKLLAVAHPGWRLEPATVAAEVQANATLVPGAEAVRVEFVLPEQRRSVVFPGGRAEAVVGAEALLNLDRDFLSGRVAVTTRELAATAGPASVVAPELAATVRWPRVWHRVLAGSGHGDPRTFWRNLWWSGDYEGRVRGATVLARGGAAARGVDARFSSRGAELYEEGGLDLGVNAAEVVLAGDRRLQEVRVEATAGLLGGRVRAACVVPGLPIRPTTEQILRWDGEFSAEGSLGFDPAIFSGGEALASWVPVLAGCEWRGGLGLSGTSRFAAGRWRLAGDVILSDFGMRWPKEDFAVEGLRGRLVFEDLVTPRTRGEQDLAIGRLGTAAVALTEGAVRFSLVWPDRLAVTEWSGRALGGRVEGTGFVCEPRTPELETQVTLKGARLEELLALFDDVPAEAQGAVDGVVPVRWRDGRPGFGTGVVRLSGGEVGRVRFTRDLQLLTNGRAPGTASYAALRKVELAIQELVFSRLQIDLYPKDIAGQSLRIRLAGAPAGGEYEVPVSIDVNVNAPLEHFFKLGRTLRAPAR